MRLPEGIDKYILTQRTKAGTPKGYVESCYRDVDAIADYLVPGDVLDIGCGAGGPSVLLALHCGGKLNLVDGDGWGDRKAGFGPRMEPFNDLSVTRSVLESNGIGDYEIFPAGSRVLPEVDNVVSFLSWCWHYPASAYLDAIRVREGGVVIVDVRNQGVAKELSTRFRYVTTVNIPRQLRKGNLQVWRN